MSDQNSEVQVPAGKILVNGKKQQSKKSPNGTARCSKRKPKVEPTPEEVKQFLEKNKKELMAVVEELKQEKEKIRPCNLKQMPLLVDEAIKNLTEDLEDIDEELNELKTA